MQQPAQLTAFTFNSAGQPVTQSQVALAHMSHVMNEATLSRSNLLTSAWQKCSTPLGEEVYTAPAVWAPGVLIRVYKTRILALLVGCKPAPLKNNRLSWLGHCGLILT